MLHAGSHSTSEAAVKALSIGDLEEAAQHQPAWKQIRRLHQLAVEKQHDQYFDPATGSVLQSEDHVGCDLSPDTVCGAAGSCRGVL